MEVLAMICPKCDSRFYEDEHCSFCGFVLKRHPTQKERKETRAPYTFNIPGSSDYSIDDYSIGKIRQERFIREAM
jgi:hypothetical protein